MTLLTARTVKTKLLTDRAKFLQIKREVVNKRENSNRILKFRCDWKQSTLGCSSTIFHHLTQVRGQNIARMVNKPNVLTVRATFLQTKNIGALNLIDEKLYLDNKVQVSCDWKHCTFGCSSTIFHPLTEVRGLKIMLKRPTARTSFLQIKHWSSELHLDIKIKVSYNWNQSNLGSKGTVN